MSPESPNPPTPIRENFPTKPSLLFINGVNLFRYQNHPMASSNPANGTSSPPSLGSPVASHGHTRLVVFVSLGCILFLGFFATVVCFLIKKRSKKRAEKSEIVHVDEHFKMREAIVDGPHGRHAAMLQVEDDFRMEDKKKSEARFKRDGLSEGNPNPVEQSSNSGIEQYFSPAWK